MDNLYNPDKEIPVTWIFKKNYLHNYNLEYTADRSFGTCDSHSIKFMNHLALLREMNDGNKPLLYKALFMRFGL